MLGERNQSGVGRSDWKRRGGKSDSEGGPLWEGGQIGGGKSDWRGKSDRGRKVRLEESQAGGGKSD